MHSRGKRNVCKLSINCDCKNIKYFLLGQCSYIRVNKTTKEIAWSTGTRCGQTSSRAGGVSYLCDRRGEGGRGDGGGGLLGRCWGTVRLPRGCHLQLLHRQQDHPSTVTSGASRACRQYVEISVLTWHYDRCIFCSLQSEKC